MSEDLKVFGKTYSGVTAIQAKDINNEIIMYISGISVKSGSITPTERVSSITFDCGLSDINTMIIIPHDETPLKSGGKTFLCGIYTKSNYYKWFCPTSNNAGSSLLTPQASTSGSAFVMSGTNVTVYSYHTGTPSINAGSFEAITYDWYAW